jgi:hypothetical protein
MSEFGKNTYNLFDNYCIRTPFFSLKLYDSLFNCQDIPENVYRELLQNVEFREAVFLASKSLNEQLTNWENNKITDSKRIERLKLSVLKYAIRISTRCTPFGLFAGCALGKFQPRTEIVLDKRTEFKRSTRLDYTVLNALQKEILKNETIQAQYKYYPNNSLYKINDHYRYIKYEIKNNKRNYSLDGVMLSDYLQSVLYMASSGKTINELANSLVNDEITLEESITFIKELIEQQIIISELELSVTGANYLDRLITSLTKVNDTSGIVNSLLEIKQNLKSLDNGFGNEIKEYSVLKNKINKIVPDIEVKHLFQTDTYISTKHNSISWKLKFELKRVFELFNVITLPGIGANIARFKKDFINRFETAEVPLAVALDVETGIGYANKNVDSDELIDDFIFQSPKKRYKNLNWSDFDELIFSKFIDSISSHDYCIQITDEDILTIKESTEGNEYMYLDLPDTMSAMLEVYKEKLFIDSVGGSSAINLLGRFGSANTDIKNHITKIAKTEEKLNPQVILAEIVHLPEARTGNILHRPNIRSYEIPYLAESSLEKDKQIPISDIFVSIKNDKIILRSQSLDKEIIPRLDNAHNYANNPLPVYHFLCDMQTEHKRPAIGFSWSEILTSHEFLPRVEYRNFIISKARWKIQTKDLKNLFKAEDFLKSIQEWRSQLKMPQYVELTEGDNKLCIHLKNSTLLKLLLSTVKEKKWFILEEFLPKSEQSIVKDAKGEIFCNQIIVSYYNSSK